MKHLFNIDPIAMLGISNYAAQALIVIAAGAAVYGAYRGCRYLTHRKVGPASE